LGWLLERAGFKSVTDDLADWLARQNPGKVPLNPSSQFPRQGKKDSRWQVIINDHPESDI
jgi:hypothetical protein